MPADSPHDNVEETATEGPRINDNHQDQEGGGQRIVDIGKKSFNLKKSFQSQITASLTALTSNAGSKLEDGNMPANQSIPRGGLKSLYF